jgi:hypothetical protein
MDFLAKINIANQKTVILHLSSDWLNLKIPLANFS